MRPSELPDRLSQIHTRWSLVFDAHRDQADEASRAQQELVLRYSGAIYRYLLGMLHDPHLADDLAQDFAVRLIKGDFRSADPHRGRFRDFVKTTLRNLVIDYWRRNRPDQMPEKVSDPVDEHDPASDQAFLAGWREMLIERTWEALARVEQETGQPYFALLRLKADQPELRAAGIAEQMSQRLGRAISDMAIRKTLQRARERFAELLLDEVARSIGSTRREDIEEELGELDLLAYCQPAVDRYAQKRREETE
jgi:RNA polymerase sigma-70 factor (ECF subfamily)